MRPQDFQLTGHYRQEQKEQFNQVHTGDFLLPKEKKLMHQFMCLQNEVFAWTQPRERTLP
jgi:hypothetical protein